MQERSAVDVQVETVGPGEAERRVGRRVRAQLDERRVPNATHYAMPEIPTHSPA